mgnify:FL=1|tara:strand:+ start:623 stop:1057 length:435 start_codon:yes stop_codon:yes gene_type:complete
MVEIESNVPVSGRSKYDKYIKTMLDMKDGESFVVHDYKIVDAVRGFGWRKGYNITFRTIAKEKYRIWKSSTNNNLEEDFNKEIKLSPFIKDSAKKLSNQELLVLFLHYQRVIDNINLTTFSDCLWFFAIKEEKNKRELEITDES